MGAALKTKTVRKKKVAKKKATTRKVAKKKATRAKAKTTAEFEVDTVNGLGTVLLEGAKNGLSPVQLLGALDMAKGKLLQGITALW